MTLGSRTLLRRFFSETPLASGAVWLEGDEAQHLLKILRARQGDEVLLFDGRGGEWVARVAKRERNRAELELLEHRDVERELPFSLHFGVALPKGDRQKWLVEKLVELGASSLTPLVTTRGVAAPSSGALDRLRRGVIEASKQCGRNRLLEIRSPLEWATFCSQVADGEQAFVAHPSRPGVTSRLPVELFSEGTRDSVVAVGPEGGFTDEELEEAQKSGWQWVSLGPRILRVETACLALAAIASGTQR
jgi:16S rRNA (uracil1498-N3)-methyltransferase